MKHVSSLRTLNSESSRVIDWQRLPGHEQRKVCLFKERLRLLRTFYAGFGGWAGAARGFPGCSSNVTGYGIYSLLSRLNLLQRLLHRGLQTLQNLRNELVPSQMISGCTYRDSASHATRKQGGKTYLQLNLSFRNILLAPAATGNLLRLGDLVPHGLRAEVLERVALDGVDAHHRVGLHGREAAGHCTANPICQSLVLLGTLCPDC